GVTWTRVMATKPIPGSCTSRASIVARSWRIWSATRSGRDPCDIRRRQPCSSRRQHSLHAEDLDHVADLQVVVLLEADAALEAALHLADVVLEAAQRSDLAGEDDDVVAQQARLRLAGAGDAALGHHAAGNRPELRYLEDVADMGDADPHLLEGRIEQPGHRLLHLVGDVV